uniref:Uncharacterized protein n=1 Tax=Oryza barthii TaxID=65489 RepID=A0A0D3GGK4_9ORYZ
MSTPGPTSTPLLPVHYIASSRSSQLPRVHAARVSRVHAAAPPLSPSCADVDIRLANTATPSAKPRIPSLHLL